jgi:hypothetical protein
MFLSIVEIMNNYSNLVEKYYFYTNQFGYVDMSIYPIVVEYKVWKLNTNNIKLKLSMLQVIR